jgi:hypothetical protein
MDDLFENKISVHGTSGYNVLPRISIKHSLLNELSLLLWFYYAIHGFSIKQN